MAGLVVPPAPARIRPVGGRGARAGRTGRAAVLPGRSGPALHVRMVLGRDRVRVRRPKAISLMLQDRMSAIPSAYIQKHAPLPLLAPQQPRLPRPGKTNGPGKTPGRSA